MASMICRRSVGGLPRFLGSGSMGLIKAHWASVMEEGYRAIFIARKKSFANSVMFCMSMGYQDKNHVLPEISVPILYY